VKRERKAGVKERGLEGMWRGGRLEGGAVEFTGSGRQG